MGPSRNVRRAQSRTLAVETRTAFTRDLWRRWTFAHNGHLGPSNWPLPFSPRRHDGCELLSRLVLEHSAQTSTIGPRAALDAAIAAAFAACASSFASSQGSVRRQQRSMSAAAEPLYLTRRAPVRRSTLIDDDLAVDFAAAPQRDVVSVIADAPRRRTRPWTPIAPGMHRAYSWNGSVVAS